ncbi:hypothetical protein DLM45_04440 [Hyphomicrobium methylovorum]|uniref:lysylphosphatidylglycerol synthase domain-containing protein n=1 Tax=Hyphomicrobium methylovorum TaxID=84 RepID=UPI0015E6580C|nr:lysylphosphatidylglycerol synthase domain-containing protein [Hyphomicrobium methylovorum]MBA2125473.1 hypothetical protein [Hyphomicrobium methylovorum]
MKASVTIGALLGIALATALVVYYGSAAVGEAVLSAGWRGLLAMTAAYLASVVLCALAWRVLILPPFPHAVAVSHWVRLVRDSVGNVLAIIPAMGEMVAARELTAFGIRSGPAIASTVVDLTLETISQLFFTLLGLVILAWQRPDEALAGWALLGVVLSALAMAGFVAAQRMGLFRVLQSLPERLGLTASWNTDSGTAQSLHDSIEDIYRDPRRLALSTLLHFAAWIVGAAEAWVALWFMGHPLSFGDILVIESLIYAIRSVAFAVPWAAGVQEGGYVAFGALFGLGPEVALGLSLLKRAREVLVSIPILLVWQAIEARRLLAKADDGGRA